MWCSLNNYGVVAASALVLAQPALAADRDTRTGTHLDNAGARPMVLQISEPSVLDRIQSLLGAGETEEAVRIARRYVESFDRTLRVSMHESLPPRYFALNALCIALTQHGELDEAAAACTEAIRILPDRWSAINNRGTARYVAGRFGEALADYRLALRVAPPESNILATIEHNIALTRQRQIAAGARQ